MNTQNREMTGVSDYVCMSTFCVRRSNSERDWTLLRRSIRASFRVCSCVYVNFSFMKRQQKLSIFFKPKRVATESEDQGELEETNDEGGEISTTASQPAEVAELPVEPTASTSTTVRKFHLYYYHNNLTQTIFEMTQFKMSRGTFDPLSIISRLNTDNMADR